MLRIHKEPIFAGALFILVFPWVVAQVPGITHYANIMVFAGIYCLMTIGLSLLMGYAGQISLGHAAFFGIGAYVSSILAVKYGISPWLGMVAGALVNAIVAMATLAFGIIINIVFREEMSWTGGPDGMSRIPSLDVIGYRLTSVTQYYYLVWGVVAAAFWFTINLLQSPVGRALRAIHTSEAAAGAMGIPISRYKIIVFTFSAVLASLGGSLYAHYMKFINPSTFDLFFSIKLIIMIALGGMHSIWGAVIGAVLIAFLSFEWLHFFGEFEIVVYGLVLLLVTIFLPEGLVGLPAKISAWMRRPS
jgi:branched-chain amino acid transport system permease protein